MKSRDRTFTIAVIVAGLAGFASLFVVPLAGWGGPIEVVVLAVAYLVTR